MHVQTYFNEDLYNLEISASHSWSIWCSGYSTLAKVKREGWFESSEADFKGYVKIDNVKKSL